jgi:hypothetical protein
MFAGSGLRLPVALMAALTGFAWHAGLRAQPAPAPATWLQHDDTYADTRLAWSTPGLQDFLNYGYVVCNADRTHAILLHFKFNSINEKKIGPRQCFGVDSPTRLDLVTEKREPLKIRGLYQVYRWGSFGKGNLEGVTFPLGEDEKIAPPVKGARVHGVSAPREETARCEKVPANWDAAQDFVSYCKLPLPPKRIANYRLCFPDDAIAGAKGAPSSALRLVTSESNLKDRARLFHTIVAPGGCIDLHEQSEAWALVSKKGAEGFDPEKVTLIKVWTQRINK